MQVQYQSQEISLLDDDSPLVPLAGHMMWQEDGCQDLLLTIVRPRRNRYGLSIGQEGLIVPARVGRQEKSLEMRFLTATGIKTVEEETSD